MEIKDFFKKVDKNELKEALASNDQDALKKLAGDDMEELTSEQIEYIAGGYWDEESCTSI